MSDGLVTAVHLNPFPGRSEEPWDGSRVCGERDKTCLRQRADEMVPEASSVPREPVCGPLKQLRDVVRDRPLGRLV